MEISIDEATESDLPFVLDLYREVLDFSKPILTIDEAQSIFEKISQYPDYHLYIVKFGKEIVGSFALLIMDNLAHLGTPSAIVEDVVVAENYQNKGIGKLMMQYAMKNARVKGCYKMVLSSNLKRKDAHRFYESLGFEKHGLSFVVEL
ncbi:MAG: GNAT family N-acetyltransferase [Bacteroidota bacterium]